VSGRESIHAFDLKGVLREGRRERMQKNGLDTCMKMMKKGEHIMEVILMGFEEPPASLW